ncbi:S41 family peptidase [Mesorhizobium sp. M0902]|uniref:S41 family peptidase n=1 Tax=Mesorhizobium sp. M0902 TaxID=2957021 RepID=UPI003337C1E4
MTQTKRPPENPARFTSFVAAKVSPLPASGLIIDLRGNPGGYIKAGELLLQLFTSQRISPLGFRFRPSDAVEHLLSTSDYFDAWEPTVSQGTRLGEEHSGTFPIEDDEAAFNKIGQVYSGPSVLIVDALTFSTADIFTAGFLDHEIGQVICTDENISAGGANNWQYNVLRAAMPGFAFPLSAEFELESGQVGPITVASFASAGTTLSSAAVVKRLPDSDFGKFCEITENGQSYKIGKMVWLRSNLAAYFPGDNRFVDDLPAGVDFGFSIRQGIRKRGGQGLVLEDEGIVADHYYRMSATDVLSGNADLISYACGLLSKPVTPRHGKIGLPPIST